MAESTSGQNDARPQNTRPEDSQQNTRPRAIQPDDNIEIDANVRT